jgi:hypothetical protein
LFYFLHAKNREIASICQFASQKPTPNDKRVLIKRFFDFFASAATAREHLEGEQLFWRHLPVPCWRSHAWKRLRGPPPGWHLAGTWRGTSYWRDRHQTRGQKSKQKAANIASKREASSGYSCRFSTEADADADAPATRNSFDVTTSILPKHTLSSIDKFRWHQWTVCGRGLEGRRWVAVAGRRLHRIMVPWITDGVITV